MSYVGESFASWILIIISVLCISAAIIAVIYQALRRRRSSRTRTPKLPMRDFTLEELQQFDGNGPDGRILLAVNGNVFDVTENGQNFYGKGAPYSSFAGKDVSRALACFKAELVEVGGRYDDLSDLSQVEMERLREWELQFSERYDHIGRLLRPGEPHRVYEETDEPPVDATVPQSDAKKSI
ncbi:cytochrome b5-like Heme/Steroid binding domain protein [Opisthorchis viverrini]|uniref:Cytochrome b5-like Heme/Steroid binding domain protein n=1 Tax=Opisthorchis viverrini TaxID=6198 RepID=A0A1S8WVM0_OPIVI|nr:cytochrome b5-like Heme/Steroid binding domain protein [Opisthorchis viverrini]